FPATVKPRPGNRDFNAPPTLLAKFPLHPTHKGRPCPTARSNSPPRPPGGNSPPSGPACATPWSRSIPCSQTYTPASLSWTVSATSLPKPFSPRTKRLPDAGQLCSEIAASHYCSCARQHHWRPHANLGTHARGEKTGCSPCTSDAHEQEYVVEPLG